MERKARNGSEVEKKKVETKEHKQDHCAQKVRITRVKGLLG
jgi:hypothetical protein